MAETRQSITINSSSAVSGDGGNHDDDDDGDDAIFQDQYMFFPVKVRMRKVTMVRMIIGDGK